MLRRNPSVRLSFIAALAVAFAALLVPHYALAQNVSQNAMAGKYSVTLKVLPAEGFMGSGAMMVRDGGAKPYELNDAMPPNHHMVVFITKDGKPVEHAHVKIWYRTAMGKMNNMGNMKMAGKNKWMRLPVVRMHVKGKGAATTHFGNNLVMKSGSYDAKVKVNGHTAIFHFTL